MLDILYSFLKRCFCGRILGVLLGGVLIVNLQTLGSGNELRTANPPWGEQERLEYAVYESIDGPQIGAAVFTIEATRKQDQDLWNIRLETLLDQPAVTVVEVDRESFFAGLQLLPK